MAQSGGPGGGGGSGGSSGGSSSSRQGGGGETPEAALSRQTQAVMSELRSQGITNLDELMRHVLANADPEEFSQKQRKLICTRPSYCFIVKK
jgi:hypothetical protein